MAFGVYWFWLKTPFVTQQAIEQPKQVALKAYNFEKLGFTLSVPENWTQAATDKAEWVDPTGRAKLVVLTSDLTNDFLALLPKGYIMKEQAQFTLDSGQGMRYFVQVPPPANDANQTVSEQLSLITSSLTKTINVALVYLSVMPSELVANFDRTVKTLIPKDVPLDLGVALSEVNMDLVRQFFKHLAAKEFTKAKALLNPELFLSEKDQQAFLDSVKAITSLSVYSIRPNQQEVWPKDQNEYRVIFTSESSDTKLWPSGLQARFLSVGLENTKKNAKKLIDYFAGAPRFYPNQTISIFFLDQTKIKTQATPIETEVKRETKGSHPWQTILQSIFQGPTPEEKKAGLFVETNGENDASLNFDPKTGAMTIKLSGKCKASAGYNLGDVLLKNFGQFSEVKKLRVFDEKGKTDLPEGDDRNSFPTCFQPTTK